MAYYELKNINGRAYWYRRSLVGGRQRSEYIGKNLPSEAYLKNIDATIAAKLDDYDRVRENLRHQIQLQIEELQSELANL